MNLLGDSLGKSCDILLEEVTNNSDPTNFITYDLNCASLANYRLLIVAAGWYTENYPSAYTVIPNINGKFGISWTTIYLNNNPSSSYIKIINLNNTSRSIDVSSSNAHCTVSVYGIK